MIRVKLSKMKTQDSSNAHPERNRHSRVFQDCVHAIVASCNSRLDSSDNSPTTYILKQGAATLSHLSLIRAKIIVTSFCKASSLLDELSTSKIVEQSVIVVIPNDVSPLPKCFST